jgi:hypothetical protein
MIPWDMCIMCKEKWVVVPQGSILASKWVLQCLEGFTSLWIRLWHIFQPIQYLLKVWGEFGLSDILSSSHLFRIFGSFLCKGTWEAWKFVSPLVKWNFSVCLAGWDLCWHPIWSWNNRGQCIVEHLQFLARRVSRKVMFLWRDLWDFKTRTLKDWSLLACQKALLSFAKLVMKDIMGLVPFEM